MYVRITYNTHCRSGGTSITVLFILYCNNLWSLQTEQIPTTRTGTGIRQWGYITILLSYLIGRGKVRHNPTQFIPGPSKSFQQSRIYVTAAVAICSCDLVSMLRLYSDHVFTVHVIYFPFHTPLPCLCVSVSMLLLPCPCVHVIHSVLRLPWPYIHVIQSLFFAYPDHVFTVHVIHSLFYAHPGHVFMGRFTPQANSLAALRDTNMKEVLLLYRQGIGNDCEDDAVGSSCFLCLADPVILITQFYLL